MEERMHPETDKKLLVIGIDGGTLDIVYPLVKAGKLPHLGGLMKSGPYGTLFSTIPPITAPAWSSFMTGTNPGKHGVFHFFQNASGKNGTQKTLVNFRKIHGTPFWRILNENGIRTGLINVPLTYPPDRVDPFMISGMLVPKDATDYTYPPSLINRLENYQVDLEGLMVQNEWRGRELVKKNRDKFLDTVFELSRNRAKNAQKLMLEEPWNFFMVVFTGSDRISHFFWKDIHNGKTPSDTIIDYYVFLDSLIGDLFATAGKDAAKLVISDHGFGPAPTRAINIFALAKELEQTVFLRRAPFVYLLNRICAKLGRKRSINPANFVDTRRSGLLWEPIYANYLGLNINCLKGSHTSCLALEKDFQSFLDEMIFRLKNLKDPLSNRSLVKKVHLREALYQGEYQNTAPRLIIEFKSDYCLIFSPLKRRLVHLLPDSVRTGEHRREGLLMAVGQNSKPGCLKRDINIPDVTSSILQYFQVPIPKSYDGHPIREWVGTNIHVRQSSQVAPSYDIKTNGETETEDLLPEDFEESKKLLENLGYL